MYRKYCSALIISFLVLGVFVVILPDYFSSDYVNYVQDPVEEPVVDAEYFSENTSLRYTVINGSFTSKSNVVYFEGFSRGGNFTLSGYGEKSNTNIWAAKNESGITSFPIKKGETVTLDFSRKYLNQLNQSVRLSLYTQRKGIGAMINYYNIYNGSATKQLGNRPYEEKGVLQGILE